MSNRNLSHPSALLYFLSAGLALLAGNCFNYAIVIYTRNITGSDGFTGFVYLSLLAPSGILTIYAGSLLDRWSRRGVLYVFQAVMAIGCFILVSMQMTGYINSTAPLRILPVSILVGTAFAFIMPSRMAILGDIVDHELIGRATIIVNVMMIGSFGLAPAVVGLLLEATSYATVFICVGGLIVLSALMLIPLRLLAREKVQTSAARSLIESFNFLKERPLLLELIFFIVAATLVGGTMQILLPEFARSSLGLGESARGIFLSVAGVGLFVGGIASAWINQLQKRGRFMLTVNLLTGFCVILGAYLHHVVFTALAFFCSAFITGVLTSMVPAAIQSLLPNEMRGRIMSLYSILFLLTPAFSGVAGGAIADWTGIQTTFYLSGAFMLVMALAALLGFRRLREY